MVIISSPSKLQNNENISSVTCYLGVTMLSTLITFKFGASKILTKMLMDRACKHLPSCKIAKFEMQQKFVQWETKKRNQPINSSGLRAWDKQLNRNYLSASFSFLFLLAQIFCSTSNFTWWYMLTCSIYLYFCWNFRCTNLSVIKVGNTVIP